MELALQRQAKTLPSGQGQDEEHLAKRLSLATASRCFLHTCGTVFTASLPGFLCGADRAVAPRLCLTLPRGKLVFSGGWASLGRQLSARTVPPLGAPAARLRRHAQQAWISEDVATKMVNSSRRIPDEGSSMQRERRTSAEEEIDRHDVLSVKVPVHGMTCTGCAAGVELGLARLPGARDVRVDLVLFD